MGMDNNNNTRMKHSTFYSNNTIQLHNLKYNSILFHNLYKKLKGGDFMANSKIKMQLLVLLPFTNLRCFLQ